ncbi:hypothetical protein LXA43DRAFT_968729 [Ganoderma leucocontextum]|nr:hypothetical protein LXA43DRAFT_968729 [Ganoderma leucocontextum]
MHPTLAKRTLASPRELDAKLELLQQLGYEGRCFFQDDEPHTANPVYLNDTDRWIQTEYNWALEEAADSATGISDLFDVEEDEEACLPHVYDPTFFAPRQSAGSPPRSRTRSASQPIATNIDKPLPSVPPLRLRNRPSLPLVPPPSPAQASFLSSPANSPPVSPRAPRGELQHTPPPSPRLATPPKSQRETEAEKRSGIYVEEDNSAPRSLSESMPKIVGRGRSCSATVPSNGHFNSSLSSPRRRQRPALPALSTSASSPQLRRLAELASTPSPSFSARSSPSLSTPVTPESDDVVTPGEAITDSPVDVESPRKDGLAEPGLASRWSLDSVASRPRITQGALDAVPASPVSKTRKRDRLFSLISSRARSGSVTKLLPPPNTPRGSTDVVDLHIRRVDSRDAFHQSTTYSSRPSFTIPPRMQQAPSLSSDSSNASSASTLPTPIDPIHALDFTDPFGTASPSCMPEELEDEDSPVFAENPYITRDSPLLGESSPPKSPSPPLPPHAPLKLQIADRPMSPGSPPPQPTLPLPSPGTPSPSFLVPSPRPQSFFASITGRPKRRKKKLVISGAPLELSQPRTSSLITPVQAAEDLYHRKQEQQRRVQNVVKWCESFGTLRKIETREDGSLHVYWKNWEVADMVCRVQAQVVIKEVGRVSLAWSYIS